MPVDHPVPVGISVKEMLPDAVPVSAKDVMDPLASVKRTNAFVTRNVVQSAIAVVSRTVAIYGYTEDT